MIKLIRVAAEVDIFAHLSNPGIIVKERAAWLEHRLVSS